MIRQFNAFNQSIRSYGVDPEVFPQHFDALVVPAVDAQRACTHDEGQERIRLDIHFMHRVSGHVKPGMAQLPLYSGRQRPGHSDVSQCPCRMNLMHMEFFLHMKCKKEVSLCYALKNKAFQRIIVSGV